MIISTIYIEYACQVLKTDYDGGGGGNVDDDGNNDGDKDESKNACQVLKKGGVCLPGSKY